MAWKAAQAAVWAVGAGIVAALFVAPAVGIAAFWNVLIPVAPALLVFAPGVWRNICPLATTAMLAERAGWAARRPLSNAAQGRLFLGAVLLLAAIVPLRRVLLNTNGPATGATLLALAALAFLLGLRYRMKSAWCSGLCPVHPVERLYGTSPALSPANAQCGSCLKCSKPCPDSVPGFDPLRATRTPARRWSGTILVGGFAGFVFGWFLVPDYAPGAGWRHLPLVYGLPLAGAAATLALFLLLRRIVPERFLARAFAAAAVACYYWFRIPLLLGFELGPGTLVDLTSALPAWFPWFSRALTSLVFLTWLVAGLRGRPWTVRPPVAQGAA
jgi:hypothetical protein